MNINRVKLKGFIGIKKGMGLDEVELDLSGLKGLIAISGPTGAGKTTLMENLQPYPQLVSRPQPALKNHVYTRDACRELDFIHNGNMVESVIKIDGHSGRSEGYISLEAGGSQVNGKISEYEGWIEKALGSSNLFFNSVFCAQNSKKLSSLRPAELKALFAEFLGPRLGQLIGYEAGAKSAIVWWDSKQQQLHGKMEEVARAAETLKVHEYEVEADRSKIAMMEKEIGIFKDEASRLEALSNTLAEDMKFNEKKFEERKGCLAVLDAIESEIEMLQLAREAAIDDETAKQNAMSMEIYAKKSLLDQADVIRSAVDKIGEMSKDLHVLNEKLEIEEGEYSVLADTWDRMSVEVKAAFADLTAEMDAEQYNLRANTKLRDEKKSEISDIEMQIQMTGDSPSIRTLENKIAQALLESKRLDGRGTDLKCYGCESDDFTCNSKNCIFIQDAIKAQENYPKLKEALEEKIAARDKTLDEASEKLRYARLELARLDAEGVESKVPELKATVEKMQAELDKTSAAGKAKANDVAAVKSQIKALTEKREATEKFAAKLPEIVAAETELSSLERALAELKAEAKKNENAFMAKLSELQGRAKDVKIKCDAIFYDPGLEAKYNQVRSDLERVLHDMAKLKENLTMRQVTLNVALDSLEKAKAADDKLKVLNKSMARVVRETAQWTYIRDACGANGLRALEIDSVAPTIAADANKLLERALGSWAMVDFNTLDSNGKEVLEPRVIDPDGDSVLIANRSGGQQVWALKAMRLAMTLISKEKSGMDYLTGYADEDDAGLDIETAKAYTKLYKEFMTFGGFEKCFIISHKPECVALANHVIKVVPGKGVFIER